jgi:hypothetical protein
MASLSMSGVKGVALFLCLNRVARRMPAIMRLSHASSKTDVGQRLSICTEQSADK